MNDHYPFVNTPLPYGYDALEPYIDRKTMELHHDRHLQTYIDNLNAILKNYPVLQSMSLEELLLNVPRLPRKIQALVNNNAGGVYNHRFYFKGLKNSELKKPIGRLAGAITGTFGSYDSFRHNFKEIAGNLFGSGYAWLAVSMFGNLKILTTANQNTPLPEKLCPILTIDVWEHAYYLKHFNKRADYISDWFNIINWEAANENYVNCLKGGCR